MVDRIVPAATPGVAGGNRRRAGVDDPCAISCEPFIQWVVEDHFVAGRPAWLAGVQMTDDVLPEQMKLRCSTAATLPRLAWLSGRACAHWGDCRWMTSSAAPPAS
ncbi:hypothetical protein MJ561_20375 [Klebsiella pneumoniae]|nr:hypothetical protein MJ561_20375 [Klebsiella pneumoniae]